MDEGLLFVLIVPTFVIVLPIVISSCILYFIFREKRNSIIGSIIGFIGSAVIGYGSQVFWYIAQINGPSSFAPFVILILSSILTASIGWIVIKIFRRRIK